MIGSRGLVLSRAVMQMYSGTVKKNPALQLQQFKQMSGSHWSYRTGAAPHSRATLVTAQLLGGFMWWWILWHLWHEFDHIIGEYPYPDPSKWTNAELGIPPDDEE